MTINSQISMLIIPNWQTACKDVKAKPGILNILSSTRVFIAVEKGMVGNTSIGDFISPQKGNLQS